MCDQSQQFIFANFSAPSKEPDLEFYTTENNVKCVCALHVIERPIRPRHYP